MFATLTSSLSSWTPAPAPLYSRFVHDVKPNNVPEHPRPQLKRAEGTWQHLNGLWELDHAIPDLSIHHVAPPVGRALPHEILVPFPIESALSGLRLQPANYSMFYRRVLEPHEALPDCRGERLLHIEKSDWNTTVWADGALLGTHLGGYAPFSFRLPPASGGGGTQLELILGVYDATDRNPNHNQAFGKQQFSSFAQPEGMTYSPSSGVWDTIWLECVPTSWISDIYALPAPLEGRGRLRVRLDINGSVDGCGAAATLRDGTSVVANASVARATDELAIELNAGVPLRLWSPETPFLYNLTVSLACPGGVRDEVVSYVGMRSIGVGRRSGDALTVVTLNGAPVYPLGVLDQGWWPDGLYAAPTDVALKSDLLALKVSRHMRRLQRSAILGYTLCKRYQRFACSAGDGFQCHSKTPEGGESPVVLPRRHAGIPGVARHPAAEHGFRPIQGGSA